MNLNIEQTTKILKKSAFTPQNNWISADPAMNTGEYFPVAPTSDEAKRHNGNLPGMGGIFNHINFHPDPYT
ncbi:hypothetical protein [Treponema sp.]|uniref:hypothetical protein n=1 Tax=Treponema sp. TaxID=166 RepID=UPI00388E1E66